MKLKTVGLVQLIVGVIAVILVLIGLVTGSGSVLSDTDILYFLVAVFAVFSAIPNLKK